MEGRPFVLTDKGYRVVGPPGWERIASDGDVALRQARLGAGLLAHGTCEGRVRPLPVLARHLRFGLRDVRDLDESPVAVAGLPGVQSRYLARLDGESVAVRAITLVGRGCVYDLVLVVPPGRVEAVAADLERFTRSFTLLPGPP